jgi:hypothetical protein
MPVNQQKNSSYITSKIRKITLEATSWTKELEKEYGMDNVREQVDAFLSRCLDKIKKHAPTRKERVDERY